MPSVSPPHVAVIGAGPAGLMAAEVLVRGGARVTVFERMPSPARKFLMAGRGGLNLTHSEPLAAFLQRYGAAAPWLAPAIEALPPSRLRAWCEELDQPTFVGSSGRVFPRAMKASPVLRAWLRRLGTLEVGLRLRHHWRGFADDGRLRFETPEGPTTIAADATVLALGGASWPRLGADGGWTAPLREAGVDIAPLQPANCGVRVTWSEVFRSRFAGTPLKRLAATLDTTTVRGEAMVTAQGLEGGALYALSSPLRRALAERNPVTLHIDLRPELSIDRVVDALSRPRGKQSLATFLRKALTLPPVAIGLLQEEAHRAATPLAGRSAADLAALVKAVPVPVTGLMPLDRAISTAGGIAQAELDAHFMLRRQPGIFVAGEMLDWEAPTGGYLLQACFATGAAAARGALAWLAQRPPQSAA